MNSKLKVFISLIFVFSLVSFGFSQNSYRPEKKVPEKEGNFEVIQGEKIFAPIDLQHFEAVAKKGAVIHGWKILDCTPGVISLILEKRDWWVKMNICFCKDEYWFEYQDSWNLDANPKKNKIHSNYYRWIANIEKQILLNY